MHTAMTNSNIGEVKVKLKEIIVNDLEINVRPGDIQEDVSLYDEGLGLDSIAIINLIVAIEKKFSISFEENEISSHLFSSLNNLAEFVDSKVNVKASHA